MKTITLTPDKTSYIFLITVCLVCAAFGVMISFHFHLIAGLLMALAFVLIAASFAWLWKFESKPQLIIDDAGIHDLRHDAGFIPWADIEDGYIRYFKIQPFLCLVLRDPESYLERFNPVKRWFSRWNGLIGFTEMSITLFGLTGADPEEIQAVIRSHIAVSDTV